jgi:hypothetical protein
VRAGRARSSVVPSPGDGARGPSCLRRSRASGSRCTDPALHERTRPRGSRFKVIPRGARRTSRLIRRPRVSHVPVSACDANGAANRCGVARARPARWRGDARGRADAARRRRSCPWTCCPTALAHSKDDRALDVLITAIEGKAIRVRSIGRTRMPRVAFTSVSSGRSQRRSEPWLKLRSWCSGTSRGRWPSSSRREVDNRLVLPRSVPLCEFSCAIQAALAMHRRARELPAPGREVRAFIPRR